VPCRLGWDSVGLVRVPLPGPRDLLTLLERGADSVEQLLTAAPRVLSLIADAQHLLRRADALVDRIEGTRSEAEQLVRRTGGVVDQAEELVDVTAPMVARLTPMLDAVEPSLERLAPTLERLAETTDPREVDALVALVDLLPLLAARMETDVVPVLHSLSTVAPDVHELLDVSRELNEMLSALPGLGRRRKRDED
jgi:ABC-type transporter Mla subunit MlaD